MARKQQKGSQKESETKSLDLDYMGSREEAAECRTIASRERLREQLATEVESFLASGGSINEIDAHATGSPIARPSSNYGDRPI